MMMDWFGSLRPEASAWSVAVRHTERATFGSDVGD